jgi:uncharacterized protein
MLKSICGVEAAPGQTVYGWLEFEGSKLPVVVSQGKSAGPTLLILGMQHAMEFSGPAAIDRALEMLDLDLLKGTIVSMPFVNPLQVNLDSDQKALAHKNVETNLNRQWPGSAESDNQFSRLAALLWEQAVKSCDALLDFHCCRNIDPRFSAALEGHAPSEKLAADSGLEAVDLQTAESYAKGLLFVLAAQQLNKKAVLIESYPGGFQIRAAVEPCAAVIMNSLVHMGQLEVWQPTIYSPSVPPAIFRRSEPGTEIKNKYGGYLAPRRWAGDRVKKGDLVAVIRSMDTFEILEELRTPIDGAVGCVGSPRRGGLVLEQETAAVVKSAG